MTTDAPNLPATLPEAVDLLNDAEFYGRPLPKRVRDAAALAIAGRFGGETAYAGTFGLTAEERAAGYTVFTGERMTSASARHIACEEATRALRLLEGAPARARQAGDEANRRLIERFMSRVDARHEGAGVVCCGNCNVAFWRHVAVGGLDKHERRLEHGMAMLHARRDGEGGWNRYPFHYTVLALSEIGTDAARRELEYAAPVLERRVARKPGPGAHAQRRHDVMARALERL